MQPLIDLFISIGDAIKAGLDFLGGIIEDLITTAEMLAQGISVLPEWLGYFFPADIVVPLIAIFVVVIIYKILGREG